MAKFFGSEKRKKRALTALAALLSVSLTAGVLAACAEETPSDEETPSTTTATDTQLLKNGNFEFYGEMDEEDVSKKLDLINTPNDWSFSPGSPSSDTKSGIVDVAEWGYLTAEGRPFESVDDAVANWTAEGVTGYDRLKFYSDFSIDSNDDFSLYSDYVYTLDYEDVQYLNEVGELKLHDHDAQVEKGDTGVLMIHNRRTSDGVRGTAQYYTSGTTITLNAGTAAKVSVWVKTSNLYHYAAGDDPSGDVEVTKRAGAYIGVTNTVGGTTLEQMQIKNINTRNVTENNGWAQYTVYIRANTFATSTFRLVLGLGQGSSDLRYEAVDGYAFFDDITCDIISADEYAAATEGESAVVKEGDICTANDSAEDKQFLAIGDDGKPTSYTYALDLYAGSGEGLHLNGSTVQFGLTEEVSGSRTYTSADIDADLFDNRASAWEDDRESIANLLSYDEIKNSSNGYLKTIFAKDFANYPSSFSKDNIILLMSTNGAAYTAKLTLPEFSLGSDERMLISFFVKTGIRSGKTGAGATVIDGGNKSAIAPFDSTTVATVDIDDERKDIYDGWVQCFFFIENATDSELPKDFRLELTYGPTSIASATANSFCDGYAAFANFEFKTLSRTEYSYASTGNYASKVSLTSSVKDETKFDTASASGPSIENGLATPSSYTGVQAGSNVLVDAKYENGKVTNANPNRNELNESGIYTGLLSSDYAKNYFEGTEAWNTALTTYAGEPQNEQDYWLNLFGSRNAGTPSPANTAYQPLVIMNTSATAKPSYGFFAKSSATLSSSSASRISVRVKLSKGATAYVYLTDVSDVSKGFNTRLSPVIPKVTYWYDDDGNIVAKDPSAKDFKADSDIAYTLQPNGLYRKAGGDDTLYANLSNYSVSDDGNLVTGDGTIAYFLHDGKYYAYYDETKPAAEQYSQPVENLPAEGSFVRYTAPETTPEAVLKVTGTDENAGKWVTLSFYVQTGDAEKQYRLELWAGARDNAESGIPAGAYVFFDRVKTETVSNFEALAAETESALRDADPNLSAGDNLPAPTAYYYTFTFYDSEDYLRYDASQDEENLGNHWESYAQSAHEEELVWLLCEDATGNLLGTDAPTSSCFLSYAAVEQTVTPDVLGETDEEEEEDTGNTDSNVNVWLILASASLAIVLVAVIVIVIVRRIVERMRKQRPVKVKKAKKKKPAPAPKKETEEEPAPAPETAKPEKDENDPYNE